MITTVPAITWSIAATIYRRVIIGSAIIVPRRLTATSVMKVRFVDGTSTELVDGIEMLDTLEMI